MELKMLHNLLSKNIHNIKDSKLDSYGSLIAA
jgi:hypothetical protein